MSLSDEEFQRFQNQLVELKTRNYQLEEQNRRITTENTQLKTQIENSEKDSINLRLPTKLPWKIRRAPTRDPDELLRENEVLSRKLHTQEEEFKLQNETMMRELNEYTIQVEQLSNELKLYKEGRHTNSNHNANENTEVTYAMNEENRRLKAENNVLQKKLSELSSKTVESISTGSSSNESFLKEDVDVECDDNRSDGGLIHILPNKSTNDETKLFDSNSIRLETEQEEKRLLQEQFRQLDISSNENILKLSKQIENLKEKLDEKQNTCLQLQHDFEKRIQEIIAESSSLKTTNELQIDVLNSDNKRLREETQTLSKAKDEEMSKYHVRFNELQMTIDQLESQIGTVAAEQNHQLRSTNAEHQRILEDRESLLNQTLLDRDSLRMETEQSKEAYETLLQTVQILEEQVTSKTREHETQQRLAEQRKTILDEMAANDLQNEEKNKSILQDQKSHYQTEIDRYEKEMNEVKSKNRTLKQFQSRCTELEQRIESEEALKDLLNTRIKELQTETLESKQHFEEQFVENEKQLDNQKQEYEEHLQTSKEIISAKAHTIEELNAQIDAQKQEISTFADEKRTHERKGAALLKDLQKQLNTEKKKNERMQEKLTELLSGDKAALDELYSIPKADGSRQGDTASISSFGAGGTGYLDRGGSVTSYQMTSTALEQENKDLIQKLARTQEERAILEEKVRHLESSSSAMANDLLQHYSNDKRGSVSSINNRYATPPSRRRQNASVDRQSGTSLNLRNMFDSLSGSSSRNQSTTDETIKNLQRMLEETLTKNMHLQKDLEAMSLQLTNQSSLHQ